MSGRFCFWREGKAEIMSEMPKAIVEKPIGINYEHPDWFRPLFEQVDDCAEAPRCFGIGVVMRAVVHF